MSQELIDSSSPSGGDSDPSIGEESSIGSWVLLAAIIAACLVVWWVGILLVIKLIAWLVLIASCITAACFFWASSRKVGEEVVQDRTSAQYLLCVAGGAGVFLWILWLLAPAPQVDLTPANLQLAAVTIVGECEESNLLVNDELHWHGTAFVYERNGSLLRLYTNAHCLGIHAMTEDGNLELDGEAEIASFVLTVTFPSGEVRPVLRVAGSRERKDIACLEVSCEGLREGRDYLIVPKTRKSVRRMSISAGEDVIALGSPLDPTLEGTQTFGKISAIRDDESSLWLQHDAGVNPGNSGGPLFLKRRGKLYWVGINTLGVTEGHSIGFSISADDVASSDYEWRSADAKGLADLVCLFGGRARAVR